MILIFKKKLLHKITGLKSAIRGNSIYAKFKICGENRLSTPVIIKLHDSFNIQSKKKCVAWCHYVWNHWSNCLLSYNPSNLNKQNISWWNYCRMLKLQANCLPQKLLLFTLKWVENDFKVVLSPNVVSKKYQYQICLELEPFALNLKRNQSSVGQIVEKLS